MVDNTASISIKLPSISCSAVFKQRPNFTIYHLKSAELNRKNAFEMEQEYSKQEPPPDILQDYISHISTVIISSVAALESKINEYIVDNENEISKKSLHMGEDFFSRFKKIKKDENILIQIKAKTSAILKYKIINQIIHNDTKIEQKVEEKINLIISIRNALIHFTPEWDNDLDKHEKIEKSVNNHNYFKLSPFYSKDIIFFPYRCLSCNCADWAIATSKSFIEEFQKLSCKKFCVTAFL